MIAKALAAFLLELAQLLSHQTDLCVTECKSTLALLLQELERVRVVLLEDLHELLVGLPLACALIGLHSLDGLQEALIRCLDGTRCFLVVADLRLHLSLMHVRLTIHRLLHHLGHGHVAVAAHPLSLEGGLLIRREGLHALLQPRDLRGELGLLFGSVDALVRELLLQRTHVVVAGVSTLRRLGGSRVR